MNEFLNKIKEQELKTVSIDFDGVIHNDCFGFHDGTIYGDIIDGAKESIIDIWNRGYNIVIFTAKAKSDRPLIHGKTGSQLVREWLDKHELSQYISDITSEKPRAAVYIDDKGIRFTDWKNTMSLLNNILERTNESI